MRMSGVVLGLATAAGSGLMLAGCGSSSSDSTAQVPSEKPSKVAGKAGFTAQSVCEAVPNSSLQGALGGPPQTAKLSEPKQGIHACSWVASGGNRAVVAVIFDDAFDKNFVDDSVAFSNKAAATDFTTATNTTIDVGARNVTVYGLSQPGSLVAFSDLSRVANTLNDFIVDRDAAG